MIPNDSLMHSLASLTAESPDPLWEDRVRRKCHAQLARRAQKLQKAAPRRRFVNCCFDAAAGIGLVAYLAIVLHATLQLALGR